MSLQTDSIFVKALRAESSLIVQLPAGDVFNTAIALPDDQAENVKPPYIIVSFDGLDNESSTKDSSFNGITDIVTIGIEIVAETRPQLASLAITVRRAIAGYFQEHSTPEAEDYALVPYSYDFQAQPVQYDSLKPCYWQKLIYRCETDID